MKKDSYFKQLFDRADNCPSRILILLQWIENNKETATREDIEEIFQEENIFYNKVTISSAFKLLEKTGLIKIDRGAFRNFLSWHSIKLTPKGKQASSNYRITHRFWKNR